MNDGAWGPWDDLVLTKAARDWACGLHPLGDGSSSWDEYTRLEWVVHGECDRARLVESDG